MSVAGSVRSAGKVSIPGSTVPSAAQSLAGDVQHQQLLAVLKAIPSVTVRNSIANAWRASSGTSTQPPPLAPHQWLPGQWTPVLYGLNREYRHYARSVLTQTLTVDLAIAVSLQRPDGLHEFLLSFPSLQHLTVLAGNGGAPVDDTPRPNPSEAGGDGATSASNMGLAIADPQSVANAVSQLLQLEPPPWASAPIVVGTPGHLDSGSSPCSRSLGVSPLMLSAPPRLLSLEIKCHPVVWAELEGHKEQLLARVAAVHPYLESFALHIGGSGPAAPTPTNATTATSSARPGGGRGGGPAGTGVGAGPGEAGAGVGAAHDDVDHPGAVHVDVGPLAALAGLAKLHLGGPLLLGGLASLTQLQCLITDGICQSGMPSSLRSLAALTSLTVTDGRDAAGRSSTSSGPPPPPDVATAAAAVTNPCRAASLLPHLRHLTAGSRLRVLRLPDVVVGPAEWPVLQALCPGLEELELAAAVPLRPASAVPDAAGPGKDPSAPALHPAVLQMQQLRSKQGSLKASSGQGSGNASAVGSAGSGPTTSAAAAAAAAANRTPDPKKAGSNLPDWFLRAMSISVDDRSSMDESVDGSAQPGVRHPPQRETAAAAVAVANAAGVTVGRGPRAPQPDRRDSDSGSSGDEQGGGRAQPPRQPQPVGAAAMRARAAAAAAGGCPFASALMGAAGSSDAGRAGSPRTGGGGSGSATGGVGGELGGAGAGGGGGGLVPSTALAGVRRLALRQHVPSRHLVQLLELLPDLQELTACLAMADPSNVLAAQVRAAATADLMPLAAGLQTLRAARVDVSCDPAAVTGQLAGVFMCDCGLGNVEPLQGVAMAVWVAASTQMASMASMRQLRSLDLTLGRQEHETELTALTQLTRLTYLSLRVVPGSWNDTHGRASRITAGAALRLAMSFSMGQVLLLVADVHREVCEDEAISLVKSVEMAVSQPGSAWPVSAWVEETAECVLGYGTGGGTVAGGQPGAGGKPPAGESVVLRVVWTPELVRRLLAVVAGVERGGRGMGPSVSFMSVEEERLGRVLGS